METKFPLDITQPLEIPFNIENFGVYALKITARCQSGNLLEFRGGQDLRVEIDNIKLREIPPKDKPQYNNIPPAWNGTELRNLNKTIFFVLSLTKGTHTLKFIPDNGAQIESFETITIQDVRKITFDLNAQAEERDRQPWYTFAFIDLPLYSLSSEISTSWHFLDGDNVKLIIDNKVEENKNSKLWKNWLWSSKPWQIFSGAVKKSISLTPNLSKGIHYIEFWADRTPTLHNVIFSLGDFTPKRIPTAQDPQWTGNFDDDSEEILLARLILGEAENQSRETRIWVGGAVLNRVKAKAWPDTIHGVALQKNQYDPFKLLNTNFPKITNPLNENKSQLRLKNWQDCYEVAKKLLSGEIVNPTTATHFNGIGVDKEYFMKTYIPQGKFLRQIDDTYFYWSPN
ncbi:cell wall hydrolase [Patescibacteria group bacterium]|nr:cell wall hydrolase [Patescibacteria group bacterium]